MNYLLSILTIALAAFCSTATRADAQLHIYYQGTVVWSQPNGVSLRGTAAIEVVSPFATDSEHNGSLVGAQLDFAVPGQDILYSYIFMGRMDSDGRGYLRYSRPGLDAHPLPLPGLDPGKIPLHLTGLRENLKRLASGGILAADGTQLTIRAEFSGAGQID